MKNFGFETSQLLSKLYYGLIFILAWVTGRRTNSSVQCAIVWMTLIALGALASPFAVSHMLCSSIFMWLLLSAQVYNKVSMMLYLLLGIILLGMPNIPTTFGTTLSILHQLILLGSLIFIALKQWKPETE